MTKTGGQVSVAGLVGYDLQVPKRAPMPALAIVSVAGLVGYDLQVKEGTEVVVSNAVSVAGLVGYDLQVNMLETARKLA